MHRTAKCFAAVAFLVGSLAACGGGDDQTAISVDSTDFRDLTRSGMDSTVQPQLTDVPLASAEPSPAASTPRPKSPPPPAPKAAAPTQETPSAAPAPTPAPETKAGPTTGVIAAGTSLALASADKVCTNTNKVGDRFTGTLTASTIGTNGALLPEGATVSIELTQLTRSQNKDQQIVMGFRVVSISVGDQTYTPDAEVVNAEIARVRAQSSGDAAKKVAGGAAAGAIVGQILGRDRKGTLIGAAVGAAAGAAAAAASDDYDGCIEVGAPITVKLNGPLSVNVGGR